MSATLALAFTGAIGVLAALGFYVRRLRAEVPIVTAGEQVCVAPLDVPT